MPEVCMKKNYVLDTNVLIHDPNSIFKFEDNDVIVPFAVLEEIDGLKKAPGETGYNAREAIRIMLKLRENGDIRSGVKINKNAMFQGMKAFKGDLMSATIRTGNSSVEYDDIEDIPSEYLIPQDPKVDTTALKIYLKSLEENGESCEFARLKYSKSLLVK